MLTTASDLTRSLNEVENGVGRALPVGFFFLLAGCLTQSSLMQSDLILSVSRLQFTCIGAAGS